MILQEKKAIINDLTQKNDLKTEELKALIYDLGIEDEEDIEDIVKDNSGLGAHKRR
jgi:hypothetical protein